MFKRCDYRSNERNNEYSYIVDDDNFSFRAIADTAAISSDLGYIIIKEYSARGLSVAPNLFLALTYISKYLSCSLETVVEYNKKYNDLWCDYEKEFEKYMVLL